MPPVTQTLRQAESFDDRSREVLQNIISSESLQAQIRDSLARSTRGEEGKLWDAMVAEARAERSS